MKKESEDAWVINEDAGVYAVLDGATPLTPFEDPDGHNGAYLAAHIFKNHLDGLTSEDGLENAVQSANQFLYQQMKIYGVDVSKGYERWTTCVAAVKVEGDFFEFIHLGDTMIIAAYHDGEVEVLTEDTVKGISQRAEKKRLDDRNAGGDVPEESYFDNKWERLRYNRTMANLDEGYTVADGLEHTLDGIQKGSVSLKKVKNVLILSDGLFHRELSLPEVFKRIERIGLAAYIDELTQDLEEHQKPIDDRTAVWLDFGEE